MAAASTTRTLAERVLTALYAREPHAKAVVAATGGGSSAAELLFRAGSSSTMLQFTVPYARASLQTFVNEPRDLAAVDGAADQTPRAALAQFCSQETAERMAVAAWKQAQDILRLESEQDDPLHAHTLPNAMHRFRASVGVACTASLATTAVKRGLHQCFFSVCRADFAASGVLVSHNASNGSNGATDSSMPLLRKHCETFHLNLSKTRKRTRSEEDHVVSHWLVYLLAQAVGVDPDATSALHAALLADQHDDDEVLTVLGSSSCREVQDPLAGICDSSALQSSSSSPSISQTPLPSQLTSVAFVPHPDDARLGVVAVRDFAFRGVVLSGSFNPLHDGHVALARAAQQLVREHSGADLPIAFELAVANADKGAIAAATVLQRVAQFRQSSDSVVTAAGSDSVAGHGSTSTATTTAAIVTTNRTNSSSSNTTWPVLVTNATLFSQKAALLPGCMFVIGADTAERLVDAKYYGGDPDRMVLTLAQIARCGCSFVVAGRVDDSAGANRFVSADDVLRDRIPAAVAHLFVPLSEAAFRSDVSSTKLRAQQQQQQLQTQH